jgi:hypothetical protein
MMLCSMVLCGMIWYGGVLWCYVYLSFCVVWCCVARCGVVWYGVVLYSMCMVLWYNLVWCGMCILWCDKVRYWAGTVLLYGVVYVIWCIY